MARTEKKAGNHSTDAALADYLDNLLSASRRKEIETHAVSCDECLTKILCAYESVKSYRKNTSSRKKKEKPMRNVSLYLIFAIVSFLLSFIVPRFFLQFLSATLLLGAKWVADSRSTKMLVMIHEAWKNDGERGASEVIKRFDSNLNKRL